MTERKKRKPRDKNKETKVSLKNKNKISIKIDNSKITRGRAKKITQQPKTPYQQIVQIPQPYPIYQPQPLSLADVINSISQKNTQQEVKEMRRPKEMTIDEEIPQYMATPIKRKEELPIVEEKGQMNLDDFLETNSPEEIENFEKIIKDTDNKRRENLRKRENLREQLREVGVDDLEIEMIKNNVSKMEKLLRQYIKGTPEKPLLK
jgi:hypothetical protein